MSCVLQAYHRLVLELLWSELLAWSRHLKEQRKDSVMLFGSCSSEPASAADQVAAAVPLAVAAQVVAVELAAAVVEVLAAAVEGDTSLAMKAAAAELHGMMMAMAAVATAACKVKVEGSWHEAAQVRLLEEVPASSGFVTKSECLHRR